MENNGINQFAPLDTANSVVYTSGRTVTKTTVRVREYDDKGNLVKETETVTEYNSYPYQYQNPYVWYAGQIQSDPNYAVSF